MNITADKFISLREEQKLFKAIAKGAATGDRAAIVDMMLFNLLMLTGLRISEALNLKWDDIHDDFLTVHYPKSGKTFETVLIGNKLHSFLNAFKESNPYSHSKYLFNTQKGPMKRTNAHDRLKYWLKVAGLRESISCHSFRHTYVTHLMEAGLPLPFIRSQARHANISTTSTYLHFSKENTVKLKELF